MFFFNQLEESSVPFQARRFFFTNITAPVAVQPCVEGAEKVLYGLDDIVGQSEVVIVEGELDKLALQEAGVRRDQADPSLKAPGFKLLWKGHNSALST